MILIQIQEKVTHLFMQCIQYKGWTNCEWVKVIRRHELIHVDTWCKGFNESDCKFKRK